MSVLAPGARVDRFEVEALLGRGGLAEVYLVRHERLGAQYALKVVTVPGKSVARRLLQEGRIQAQLKHPAIVGVSDVIEFDNYVALVLEYIEGASVRALLDAHGRLEMDVALSIFSHVLAAVGAAHQANVLHRDLKPDNVLLAPAPGGCVAKVADFGIAKLVADAPGQGETAQGVVMGTPGYMAPEQCDDASTVDARADIFSLGVMLYEVLTGVSPFERENLGRTLGATLSGQYTPIRQLRDDVPETVVDVVRRCLQVDPDARFPDVASIARALYAGGSEGERVGTGQLMPQPIAMEMPADLRMRPAGVSVGVASSEAQYTAIPADLAPPPERSAPETLNVAGPLTTEVVPADPPARNGRWILGAAVVAFCVIGAVGVGGLMMYGSRAVPPAAPVAGASTAQPVDTVAAPGVATPTPAGTDVAVAVPSTDGTPTAPISGTPTTPTATPGLPTASPVATTAASTPTVGTPATEAPVLATPVAATAVAGTDQPPAPLEPTTPVATTPDPGPTPGAAAPEVTRTAPPEPAAGATSAAPVDASGTWKGSWNGRPMTLRIRGSAAELEVLQGTNYRIFQLRGSVSPEGRFEYSGGAGADAWWVSGTVSGGTLTGAAKSGAGGKATVFTAKKK